MEQLYVFDTAEVNGQRFMKVRAPDDVHQCTGCAAVSLELCLALPECGVRYVWVRDTSEGK